MGIPTILESHVPEESGRHLLRSSRHLLSLVVISDHLQSYYAEDLMDTRKLLLEPDAVDLRQYTPELSAAEARQALGIPQNHKICLYCGHLHAHRGLEEIIAAAKALPEVHFHIVGGWPEAVAHYQSICEEAGVESITFWGHVPNSQVPLHLFSADILLMPYGAQLPTAERCSPLKLYEYMAANRPIIASRIPAIERIFADSGLLTLIPPSSASALTDAISTIMADPEPAKNQAKLAREYVANKTWQSRAERILAHACQGRLTA
jgi:glycosyltransferase involved in cell wall biosynthesis